MLDDEVRARTLLDALRASPVLGERAAALLQRLDAR